MKQLLYCSAVAVAAMIGVSSCCNAPKATFNNDIDTVSYAYGVNFGSQFSNFGDSNVVVPGEIMNAENFLAGFSAAFKKDSANTKISAEEARRIIQNFQIKAQQKVEEEMAQKAAENKEKGTVFMAENAKREGVQTLESGLQYEVVKEGKGNAPKEGDRVKVNYKGTLVDGTVFDQNENTEFPVNGVVKGFKEGLMLMKEGGKAILTMPSDLAYGDRGAGQHIQGGATLQFEVELLQVIPAKK